MATKLFSKYGLEENPFFDQSASEKWLTTWVGREKEVAQWGKVLKNGSMGQKNQIAFIIGQYGRGKTLSLLKIIKDSSNFENLYPLYLNFQGEQKSKNPGLDFLFRLIKSISIHRIISNVSEKKLIAIFSKLPENFEEPINVLISLKSKERNIFNLARYFLTGETKPTKKDLNLLNVIRKIDDIEIAKEYLFVILYLLKSLGKDSLIFAIDEFEYLFSLIAKPQRTIYLALFRGLYDFPMGVSNSDYKICKMTFFISMSEDGFNLLKNMEEQEVDTGGGPIQPLFRRVDLETTLTGLSIKETKKLIVNRLSFDRIKNRRLSSPLIPFHDDYVKFVYEYSNGEPWKIIQICDHVLDAGIEKEIKVLNKKFAQQVIADRKL